MVVVCLDKVVKFFEVNYLLVIYFFVVDCVEMYFVSEVEYLIYCFFKGYVLYWNLIGIDGVDGECFVWSYEELYDECEGICGYVVFYGDCVIVEEF